MRKLPHWATGPAEVLQHGFELLTADSDKNRRLAMISIDNSVELTMQTFISLPKRITGIDITRKQRDDYCSSFPSLLDGIEKEANERIVGINLGEIEWLHRLRNELYHQGNGLTVEKAKVEAYSQIALELFKALFEEDVSLPQTDSSKRLGEFLEKWIAIERYLVGENHLRTARLPELAKTVLSTRKDYSENEMKEFFELRDVRNRVMHGADEPENLITDDIQGRLDTLLRKLKDTPF